MTKRDEEQDSGELTPPEIVHTYLPDQTMYKVEDNSFDDRTRAYSAHTAP